MSPSLEVHVPVSPTRRFFLQVQFLAHSLRANGGQASDAPIVVTVGDRIQIPDLASRLPWCTQLGVSFLWVGQEIFEERSYFATAVERWRHESSANLHWSLDADTLIVAPIDDLMEQCQMEPALYGMITHVSPLKEPYTWHDLFTSFGLTTPPLNHEHLGWGYMESRPAYRTCPAYFNLGSLLAPTSFMYRIGEVIYDAMDAVDRVYHTDFRCQIGLTLAAAKSGVPLRPVNARYNFANDVHIEALFPEEQRNAVVIHYLREHQNIGRDAIFNDRVSMLKYLDREDLRLTNQTMQAELRRWFDAVDAEQGEVAPEFRW